MSADFTLSELDKVWDAAREAWGNPNPTMAKDGITLQAIFDHHGLEGLRAVTATFMLSEHRNSGHKAARRFGAALLGFSLAREPCGR